MAKNTILTSAIVNLQANALASELDGGYIDVYDGKQPASAEAPITTQTLGVTLSLGSPAFAPADKGILSSNPVRAGVASNKIKATWARITKSDHKTPVMDVSVGVTDANITLPTTNIEAGVTVSCTSFMHTVPKSAPGT